MPPCGGTFVHPEDMPNNQHTTFVNHTIHEDANKRDRDCTNLVVSRVGISASHEYHLNDCQMTVRCRHVEGSPSLLMI
jgi:hypothetical protein